MPIYSAVSAQSWYSPKQALCIAITFAIIDLFINIFGLAWNGKFFTFDNLEHWFDFSHYKFTNNPIDFLAVSILRICILIGGALNVCFNPKGVEMCAKFLYVFFKFIYCYFLKFIFAFIMVIIAFSPIKLLAFYEHNDFKSTIANWILLV
jgi:hypothetical protein